MTYHCNPDESQGSKLMFADIQEMGMPLKLFKWKSCYARIAEGEDWVTVYLIESSNPGKGEATELLKLLKHVYKDRRFGITVGLNDTMKHIIKKLGITEYDEEFESNPKEASHE